MKLWIKYHSFFLHDIPLLLEIGHEGVYNCEIHAGFVGLTQNNETASIKPEIWWFIKMEGKNGPIRFRNCDDEIDKDLKESQVSSKCCLLI